MLNKTEYLRNLSGEKLTFLVVTILKLDVFIEAQIRYVKRTCIFLIHCEMCLEETHHICLFLGILILKILIGIIQVLQKMKLTFQQSS